VSERATCGNCRFFKHGEYRRGPEGLPDVSLPRVGFCCVDPPKTFSFLAPLPAGGVGPQYISFQPQPEANDPGCSRHQPVPQAGGLRGPVGGPTIQGGEP